MKKKSKKIGDMQLVRTAHGVDEYVLSNGLQVLHKYDDAAPVVAVMATYRVGSRNEAVGHTGSTHILEHLLFKDSKNFNKKNKKQPTDYMERLGAVMNATTSFDRTNYYELVPKQYAEEALAMEADRMRNSLFSKEDLATEMTVVRNEYERHKNMPEDVLEEAVWSTAFMAHPYHHPIIGWKDDIEYSTVEKLREFYNRFYYPNNATVSIFGAIEKKEMERIVLKYFAKISPASEPIPQMHTKEPLQEGSRRIEIEHPGETSLLAFAHKIPEGIHSDFSSYLLISQILAGGLASRLQRALVDSGMATHVQSTIQHFHDPSIMYVMTQPTPGNTPEKLLTLVRKEYEKFKKDGPTSAELIRAKEQIKAVLSYGRDGILSEISAVNEAIAAGDWTLLYKMEHLIENVTADDIRKVSKIALVPQRETIGILYPKKK